MKNIKCLLNEHKLPLEANLKQKTNTNIHNLTWRFLETEQTVMTEKQKPLISVTIFPENETKQRKYKTTEV